VHVRFTHDAPAATGAERKERTYTFASGKAGWVRAACEVSQSGGTDSEVIDIKTVLVCA
jgi:hypothetical protein